MEGTSRIVQMRRVEDQCWSIRERIGVAWQLGLEQPWEQPVAGRLRTTACCTNLCWARSSPQPVSSSSAQPAGGLAPPAGEVRRTEIVRLRWFWWYERGEGWGGGGMGVGEGLSWEREPCGSCSFRYEKWERCDRTRDRGLETESDTPLEAGWCAPPPASLPFHRISESSHHHHHPGSTWKSRELAAKSVNISQNPLQPLFCETRPGSFRAMGGWVPNLARMQIDVGPISELAQTVLCWNTIGRKFLSNLVLHCTCPSYSLELFW